MSGCSSGLAPDSVDILTPLDLYLAEQGRMSAVERFALLHDDHRIDPANRYYRDLIPATPPGPGQQYGFAVDLDSCTACKACVVACHTLNGLDEGESHRVTGLHHGIEILPMQQTITTACHHCVDPGCLAGCPTQAYDKDPVTGIVTHVEEKCLGCGYCIWTCPYEVPQMNKARGVVRKCDMCTGRLSDGQAPACVSACPNGAITITLVDVADLVAAAAEPRAALLATAPPSRLTVPTTTYTTAWGTPADVKAADHLIVRPGHGHRPLVVMLVLTQLAAGMATTAWASPALRGPALAASVVLALAGMVASVAHLGHPERLWRALAGLRTSWLSREVAALGAFTLATAWAAASPSGTSTLLASGLGWLAVASSAMVYVVTGRPWWNRRLTFGRFAFTAAGGGLAGALALGGSPVLGWVLASMTLAAAGLWLVLVRGWMAPDELTHLRRSALLLTGPMAQLSLARVVLALFGGVLVPVLVSLGLGPALPLAVAGYGLFVAGEMIERLLFFRAAAWTAMPGVLD
ncbi:MAG: DmsC/YnfH family molybdoenzyme membrane anchor subunit [Acidimicrobiales bacterium]